jgi:hypothetical protein
MLCLGTGAVALGIALVLRERSRRLRFREAERLSRSLFAAAGVRRRSTFR